MTHCEFCETAESVERKETFAYRLGDDIAYCCKGCAGEQIATDNLAPYQLPKGWEIVPTIGLDAIKKGNAAFLKVSEKIRANAVKLNVPRNHVYDLDTLYENVIAAHERSLNREIEFRRSIGIKTQSDFMWKTSAYCPCCCSNLLHLVGFKLSSAIQQAAQDSLVCGQMSDATCDFEVYACLGCGGAFVGKYKG